MSFSQTHDGVTEFKAIALCPAPQKYWNVFGGEFRVPANPSGRTGAGASSAIAFVE